MIESQLRLGRDAPVMNVSASVLKAIGNTSLVELRRVVPPGCARILVKLEGQNPTGSMKDRMAQAMIGQAGGAGGWRCRRGVHRRQYRRLACPCLRGEGLPAAHRHLGRLQCGQARSDGGLRCGADGRSQRRRAHRQGAGRQDDRNRSGYRPTVRCLLDRSAQQRRRVAQLHPMERIDGGQVSAFVQSIGTAASLRGVATVLRRRDPGVGIIAVEPGESAVLSGGQPGAHRIEEQYVAALVPFSSCLAQLLHML